MIIITTSTPGGFKILKDSTELVQVVYSNYVPGAIDAKFRGETIKIRGKNILTSNFVISKNGEEIGEFKKISWWAGDSILARVKNFFNSHYVLTFTASSNFSGKKYFLDRGGRNDWFELQDEKKNSVIRINRNVKLLKLETEYQVEVLETFRDENQLVELLIYLADWAEYYTARNPSTTAG